MSPQTRRIFRQTSGVRLLSPESCSEEGIRSRHMVIKLLGKFVYFRQKITDVRSSFTESITVMQDVIKKVWLSQPTWTTKATMGHTTHGTRNSTHGTCNSTHTQAVCRCHAQPIILVKCSKINMAIHMSNFTTSCIYFI